MATKTKATLKNDVTAAYPDNTTGLITPLVERTSQFDQIDSWQQAPQVNVQTGTSYTLSVDDYGKLVIFNSASPVTVSLPAFAVWNCTAGNIGAGTVTITPTTGTIGGQAALALATGQYQTIVSDGTNYQLAQPDTSAFLRKAGDTMTGDLVIAKATPAIHLRAASGGRWLNGESAAGALRWQVIPGDGAVETGSNTGSNFSVWRYDDAGAAIDAPLSISRASGQMTLTQPLNLPADPTGNLQAATKQYVDNKLGVTGVFSTGPTALNQLAAFNDNTGGVIRAIQLGSTLTLNTGTSPPTLDTNVGGGNVNNSGTPVNGQLAQWISATAIQGINVAGPLAVGAGGLGVVTNPTFLGNVTINKTDGTAAIQLIPSGGGNVQISAGGTDTNIGVQLSGKGANLLVFYTHAFTATHLAVGAQAGANQYVQINGGVSAAPSISSSFGRLSITGADLITAPTAPTPAQGDNDISIATTAFVQTEIKAQLVANCGILEFVSATALSFKPKNGDRIKINGTTFAIPAAGITGLANTGVFVNGTAGQNLAASTLYYVYAFNNAGTVTADFSTTTHATSTTAGNVGTEIKNGDDTRSLIGMIRTNASSQFANSTNQRFVRSWFNDPGLQLIGTTGVSGSTTSGTHVELSTASRIEGAFWANEPWQLGFAGYGGNSIVGGVIFVQLMVDGAAIGAETGFQEATASYVAPLSNVCAVAPAEGYHYANLTVRATGGTSQMNTGFVSGIAAGR